MNKKPAAMDDPRFAALVASLKRRAAFKDVVADYETARARSGSGFGKSALRVNGKIFAMTTQGHLVLKLPQARVDALIASGDGAPFTANKGKPMKEWVTIVDRSALSWTDLAREAHDFVSNA
jgi:hypothetical protein